MRGLFRRSIRWRIGIALFLSGCVSDSPPSTVQIFSWWTTASEDQALQAVLTDFKKNNPNVMVVNVVANNALNAEGLLQSQVSENAPPDTFQVNGGAELGQYIFEATPSPLKSLQALAVEQNWEGTMPSVILDAARYKGLYYAVPVDIARVNALFYNKAVLASVGITSPPTTLAEFVADAQQMAANNVVALAIGDQAPWALEVIFKSCLLAVGTPQYYTEFYSGVNPYFSDKSGATSDPTFSQAIDCFATFLAYSNKSEMRGLTWADAVDRVSSGVRAMTIMGDWAHGEFNVDLPDAADVKYGEVAVPGTGDTFIYTTDTFVLPTYARNPAGAMALLTEWGSAEGQSVFYKNKGSLPSRNDADPEGYDALQKWTLAEFQSKTLVPDWALTVPQAFTTSFDVALDRFADDGNAENLVLAAKNNYDMLTPSH